MKSQNNVIGVAGEVRAESARQQVSGRELARRLNTTPVYVSRRLSGEVEFSETDIRRFAEVLGINPSDLLATTPRGARRIEGSAA